MANQNLCNMLASRTIVVALIGSMHCGGRFCPQHFTRCCWIEVVAPLHT